MIFIITEANTKAQNSTKHVSCEQKHLASFLLTFIFIVLILYIIL